MGRQGVIGDLFRVELRRERERHGLSQLELANAVAARHGLAMYASTIAKIEAGGRDVRVDELFAFADLFDVSTDALLGRPGSAVDVAWAASRLSSTAGKMVHEVLNLQEKLSADVDDVRSYADREHKDMVTLFSAATRASAALGRAATELNALASEFPLPGIDFGPTG